MAAVTQDLSTQVIGEGVHSSQDGLRGRRIGPGSSCDDEPAAQLFL
jgi:hypothetical protein